ncbi:MAG: hypothetical protein Tsb0017_21520 [Geothermobacteraceae bacterium]
MKLLFFDVFTKLGFSELDQLLMIICPIFSLIGSFVHILMLDLDFSSSPEVGSGNNLGFKT